MLFLALESSRPIREVTEFADHEVRQALENVSGVGQVTIVGGRKRQIQVMLDPARLRAAGLTAVDVQRAVVAQNIAAPGGAVDTGPQRLTFRVSGRVQSVQAIEEIVVRSVEGHPILVRDVGKVVDGEEEAETAASIAGKPAVVLSIRKQSGSNSVAVVDALMERVKEVTPTSPRATSCSVIRDNTETTRTSVDAVKEHLVPGRCAGVAGRAAVPGQHSQHHHRGARDPDLDHRHVHVHVAGWGSRINTITLLALALAVGIVIDDAIVVLENIFRCIEEKKIRPMPAAIYATSEIGLAVLATTLSLLAVFLPVAFMQSIPGRFLRSFGLTMGASIAISLLVSFTLTPMLASRWLRLDSAPEERRKNDPRAAGRPGSIGRSSASTWSMLGFLLRDRKWRRRCAVVRGSPSSIAAGCGIAAIVTLLDGPKAVPKGFLPKNDEAQFEISVRTPEGTSLAATQIAAERIAREVREWPEVQTTLLTHRRQPAEDAQPGVDLRAPRAARQAPASRRTSCRTGSGASSRPRSPRNYRVSASAGGGVRRRHVQHGDRAVHPERAGPRPAHQVHRPRSSRS